MSRRSQSSNTSLVAPDRRQSSRSASPSRDQRTPSTTRPGQRISVVSPARLETTTRRSPTPIPARYPAPSPEGPSIQASRPRAGSHAGAKPTKPCGVRTRSLPSRSRTTSSLSRQVTEPEPRTRASRPSAAHAIDSVSVGAFPRSVTWPDATSSSSRRKTESSGRASIPVRYLPSNDQRSGRPLPGAGR